MKFTHHVALLATITGLAQAQGYSYAGLTRKLAKDNEQVAANFPDVEGFELFGPAFTNPKNIPDEFVNGTAGPTPQASYEQWLQELVAKHEWMTYHARLDSEEGRSIPYVYLSNTTSLPSRDKVRVWMTGSVHGDEPAGEAALLSILGKLDSNATWAESLLSKADLLIMPRYNPDGVEYFQRYLASGFDPNRDHTRLARQQTRDIKTVATEFDPHVAVDCHEFVASRTLVVDKEYLPAQDGQFSAMKNTNVHKDIRTLQETLFFSNMRDAMDAHDLRWSPYVVVPDPAELTLLEIPTDTKTDVHAYLSQSVQLLTETRGITLGNQHFQRRTVAGHVLIEAVLQTVIDNADIVRETVEDARADYINSDEEIVVTDHHRMTNISWPFIRVEDGEIVEKSIKFGNNTPAVANLTRPRPEGYIFSRAWSDVADILRATGVEVETLQTPFKGEVEAVQVLAAELEATKFEGVARTTITDSELVTRQVEIPAGAYWVPARQRMAAHAFVRLEPEHRDSLASFNILPVAAGDEYPVFRVPRRKK